MGRAPLLPGEGLWAGWPGQPRGDRGQAEVPGQEVCGPSSHSFWLPIPGGLIGFPARGLWLYNKPLPLGVTSWVAGLLTVKTVSV